MTRVAVFASAARPRPPRIFLHGCLSDYISGGPGYSLGEWFEVYGRSWRIFWRWLSEYGVMPYADRRPLVEREWHGECEADGTCHSYEGTDYHYCTPDYRCLEWSKRQRERSLPPKAQVGWSGWFQGVRK